MEQMPNYPLVQKPSFRFVLSFRMQQIRGYFSFFFRSSNLLYNHNHKEFVNYKTLSTLWYIQRLTPANEIPGFQNDLAL